MAHLTEKENEDLMYKNQFPKWARRPEPIIPNEPLNEFIDQEDVRDMALEVGLVIQPGRTYMDAVPISKLYALVALAYERGVEHGRDA